MNATMIQKKGSPQVDTSATGTREMRRVFAPPVDIFELDAEYVLVADMPGVSRESLDVIFDKGRLSVTGSVLDRGPEKARRIHREYELCNFHRTFHLGEDIDASGIEAQYEQGTLIVHLPKTETARPRKISIKR